MSDKLRKLRNFNLKMAGLHAVQALVLLAVSSDFTRSITQDYVAFNESTQSLEPASRVLFDVQLAPMIAAFLGLSALAHLYIATIGNDAYNKQLKLGMNKFRWYEYSLSASLMIVVIGVLSGIFDLSTLILLFGVTAIMNLMGLVMEVHNQTTKSVNWLSYWIGVLAGILPWLIIGIYFWTSADAANGVNTIPTFVYFIWGSLFLFFNSFAINMVLQYKKVGKWADYLYGERVYIWLSLLAKSALAWQVFGGTLQP